MVIAIFGFLLMIEFAMFKRAEQKNSFIFLSQSRHGKLE
jgi:hypothetical protein